jgi:hypothetical protein
MVPAMTGFVVSNVAGRFADGLLARGMPLPTVRKTGQVRRHGPGGQRTRPARGGRALWAERAARCPGPCNRPSIRVHTRLQQPHPTDPHHIFHHTSPHHTSRPQSISMVGSAAAMAAGLATDDPSTVVGLVILGLTLHPFTLAGLFCTPNDLSTKYAGKRASARASMQARGGLDGGAVWMRTSSAGGPAGDGKPHTRLCSYGGAAPRALLPLPSPPPHPSLLRPSARAVRRSL